MKAGLIIVITGAIMALLTLALNGGGYPTHNWWFTPAITTSLLIGLFGVFVGIGSINN